MNIRWSHKEEESAVRRYSRKGVPAPVARCIYASRLLGTRKELVIHGGGNTSVKTKLRDPFGERIDGIFVKSSGQNLYNINIDGFTALDLENLKKLEKLDSLQDDQMLNALSQAKLDVRSPAPSVETLIHAFLPVPYIFHTHANSILAVTNQPDGNQLASKVFGLNTIILPYAISGFTLAKKAALALHKLPDATALVVMKHGIFSFGYSAEEAFENMIRPVALADQRLKRGQNKVFLRKTKTPKSPLRADLAPILRGVLSKSGSSVILEFRTNQKIRQFINGKDLNRYATAGPVTPDHVIWTKPKPLILSIDANSKSIPQQVKNFEEAYKRYFDKHNRRHGNTKIMRKSLPQVVLIKGLGLFGVGDTSSNAKAISDIAETWIEVITAAESIGKYVPATNKDIFDIEYWSPETAKLKINAHLPLKGQVALVTGGGSGIGKATAKLFRKAGAEIVVLDKDAQAVSSVANETSGLGIVVDVTEEIAVKRAFKQVVSSYGGVDIVISNAGGAWQGEIGTVSGSILRKSFELNFFAHQTVAQNAVRVMRAQNEYGGSGGSILFNTSKQAVNPGKDFGPYGLPKAATLFLVRQYALDHGKHGIRTGGVNADRVRSGLLSDQMIAKRSKARELTKEQYLTGNLLGREVMVDDVAKAFLDLALSPSTTGAILTVDGGNIEAALR